MRTTIRLDDGLLREAKRRAAETGTTLGAVIEDAVRDSFSRRGRPARTRPIALPTYRGRGLQPGVDLDDTASLMQLMEDDAQVIRVPPPS